MNAILARSRTAPDECYATPGLGNGSIVMLRGYFVVGAAGFIGSHVVDRLMADPDTAAITIYDNLSNGRD